jgi:isochorismate synthase EntC
MNGPAHLKEFLDHRFFERGAFMKDYLSDTIVLGKGGEFKGLPSVEQDETFFYLKDFYQDSYLAYHPEQIIQVTSAELLQATSSFEKSGNIVTSISQEDSLYERDFLKAKEAFNEELRKVVLVSREEFKLEDPRGGIRHFFAQALNFGTGLPYGIWSSDFGCVGSTPEILFALKRGELKTFALAGTMAKGMDEELLTSAKNLEEHRLVIRDISEKLSTIGNDLVIGETVLSPYKNLIHLKTNIEVKVSASLSPLKITSLLSPTAALGGYPQSKAMRFLSETGYRTRHPQRFFGSALGLNTVDIKQAIVVIRNIQWEGDTFIIESGGGIVEDSLLEKEIEEIRLKRESIKGHYL